MKICITGSLSSGKTTASKILSNKRGPLFSADSVVKSFYKKIKFKKIISLKFKIKNVSNIKNTLKKRILKDNSKIKVLEKIIHPFVRKEMINLWKNKNKKFTFFEIPLLVESKLMKNFVLIFIKAKKILDWNDFCQKAEIENYLRFLTINN